MKHSGVGKTLLMVVAALVIILGTAGLNLTTAPDARGGLSQLAVAAAIGGAAVLLGVLIWGELKRHRPQTPWIAEHSTDSFWLRDAGIYDDPIRAPLNASDSKTDVLIIGGGFTGLSTAWHLKQENPDLKVTLIDAARCGYGASGRNVGWCMAQNLNLPGTGSKYVEPAHQMMREGVSIIKHLSEHHGVGCDFTPASIVDLSTAKNPNKKFKPVLEVCGGFGFPAKLLETETVRARYQSDAFTGGAVYQDGSASVHPGKLGRSMRDLVLNAGVEVHEGTTVERLDLRGNTPIVITDFGRIEAGQVIIATNAFTKSFGEFSDRYMPVYSAMIATEPLSDAQLKSTGFKRGELLSIRGKGLEMSFANVSVDNRIVFGGGAPVIYYDGAFASGNHRGHSESLSQYLTGTIWPQLAGVKIDHKWGGMLAISRDLVGGIGTHPKHHSVHYALAYSGEGVSTSFASGKTLAQMVSGQDTELTRNLLVHRNIGWLPGEPLRSVALKFLF
ncbi:MAG: FAD-dependent oxidoreductase [Pseudomonadota bacterium]